MINKLIPSLVALASFAVGPFTHGSIIAFDPFSGTSSADDADPATGYYRAVVNTATGDMAGSNNASVSGGPILGFGLNDWSSSTTTYRAQLGNLDTASRLPAVLPAVLPAGRNDGAVRVLTYKTPGGGGSTAVRTLSRELDPFTAPSTYYMSAVTNIFTAAEPGVGGYFYIGFGSSAVASDGLFEGLQWGYRTNATNDGVDFVLRGRNADATAIEEVVIISNVAGYTAADTASASQFLALKVEVNPDGADTITYWLDPAYATEDPAGGVTVVSLNAFDSAASLTHFGAVTSLLRHSGGNDSTNRIGYFDSIALGTTYESVVIPEPRTYAAILGAFAFTLLYLRRRRGR